MSNSRTKWTNDRVKALRNDVNALVAKGSTKKAAYEKLSAKWKIGPDYMEGLCNRGLDAMRTAARKYDKRNGKSQRSAIPSPTTGTTMSAEEAFQFYSFLKRMNITIS